MASKIEETREIRPTEIDFLRDSEILDAQWGNFLFEKEKGNAACFLSTFLSQNKS